LISFSLPPPFSLDPQEGKYRGNFPSAFFPFLGFPPSSFSIRYHGFPLPPSCYIVFYITFLFPFLPSPRTLTLKVSFFLTEFCLERFREFGFSTLFRFPDPPRFPSPFPFWSFGPFSLIKRFFPPQIVPLNLFRLCLFPFRIFFFVPFFDIVCSFSSLPIHVFPLAFAWSFSLYYLLSLCFPLHPPPDLFGTPFPFWSPLFPFLSFLLFLL